MSSEGAASIQLSQANNTLSALSSLFANNTGSVTSSDIFSAILHGQKNMMESGQKSPSLNSENLKLEADELEATDQGENDFESSDESILDAKEDAHGQSSSDKQLNESRHSSNSAMSSSSSRRKRFPPQRTVAPGLEQDEGPPVIDEEESEDNQGIKDLEQLRSDYDRADRSPSTQSANTQPNTGYNDTPFNNMTSQPNQPNFNMNKFREFVEAQKRLYASTLNQPSQLEADVLRELYMRLMSKFGQTLKDELANSVQTSIEKVMTTFNASELEKYIQQARQIQLMRLQQFEKQRQELHQQQQSSQGPRLPFGLPPNPLFNAMHLNYPNPQALMALAAGQNPLASLSNPICVPTSSATVNANNGKNSGIFPNQSANFPSFNGFMGSPVTSFRNDDGSPRKKRSKVTDSVRGPRAIAVRDNGQSLPTSAISSPSHSYFPPTMVPHPLYNGSRFEPSGPDSPLSNDDSDYLETFSGQSSTLTHVHLRKAKLMFFYTRYPPSSTLKTYFPDIQFNKNNTAQLVKWFSNFREFYYMQMEKFAKVYLEEGMTDPEKIHVTTDSEIFKILNQHYNRNNFIQPPAALAHVIEVTLKEFFKAMRDGRNAEPSWKKAIYKVIQQYDDHIPDIFRTPQFLAQLEGNGSS